jgi:hypothetical protein
MSNKAYNNLPFTTYTVKNESSRGVNIYLGIASKGNNLTSTIDYFPHQVVACKTTYLFASIVGTRNVKITRPTTKDPYIYVETRKVQPQQVKDLEATSFLKSGGSGSMVLRRLSSDPSIVIEDNDCNYGLSTFTYSVQNACSINGFYYKTIGTPGQTNVVWQFKEIIGDPPCVDIVQNNGVITFVNIPELCCDE